MGQQGFHRRGNQGHARGRAGRPVVNAYPDTSFLCGLYVAQDTSARAAAHYQGMLEPLYVTGLLLYEFRQSARWQVYLHGQDRRKGYPQRVAERALADLQSNLDSGAVVVIPADWGEVFVIVERLSAQHSVRGGHRTFDLLHMATALHLQARELLTFDVNQRRLAEAEGLHVNP